MLGRRQNHYRRQRASPSRPLTKTNRRHLTIADGHHRHRQNRRAADGRRWRWCVNVRNGWTQIIAPGIGTRRQHEYSPEETQRLEEVANLIGARVYAHEIQIAHLSSSVTRSSTAHDYNLRAGASRREAECPVYLPNAAGPGSFQSIATPTRR